MVCNFKKCLDLFYPNLCAHCQAPLLKRPLLFCPSCLDQLTLLDTEQRCRICFAEFGTGGCSKCQQRPVIIHKQIAACELFGPSKTLFQGLIRGKRDYFSAAAAMMCYQWLELKLPLPDYIIPLPTSFWQKQKLGFDPHLLLANEVSKILQSAVLSALKIKFDAQAFLYRGEISHRFCMKATKSNFLGDKHLLLVAPKCEDGLLRLAASELKAFFPSCINALAFGI